MSKDKFKTKLYNKIDNDEDISLGDIEEFVSNDVDFEGFGVGTRNTSERLSVSGLKNAYINAIEEKLKYEIAYKELRRLYKILQDSSTENVS